MSELLWWQQRREDSTLMCSIVTFSVLLLIFFSLIFNFFFIFVLFCPWVSQARLAEDAARVAFMARLASDWSCLHSTFSVGDQGLDKPPSSQELDKIVSVLVQEGMVGCLARHARMK